jgi:hypothetical protein
MDVSVDEPGIGRNERLERRKALRPGDAPPLEPVEQPAERQSGLFVRAGFPEDTAATMHIEGFRHRAPPRISHLCLER